MGRRKTQCAHLKRRWVETGWKVSPFLFFFFFVWRSLQLAAVTSWLLLLDFYLFIYFNVRFISEAESPQIQPGIQICLQAFRQHAGNSLPTISKAQLFPTNNLCTCQNSECKSSFIYLFSRCWNGSLNQTCDVLLFFSFFSCVCLVIRKFCKNCKNCKILVE